MFPLNLLEGATAGDGNDIGFKNVTISSTAIVPASHDLATDV